MSSFSQFVPGTSSANPNNSRLILETEKTTSGTNITFESIPSWVKRITIMMDQVSSAYKKHIQLGSGGSYQTSGYTSASFRNGTNSDSLTTAFMVAQITNTNSPCTGHAVLTNISGNIWVLSSVVIEGTSNGTISSGRVSLSGTLDRLKLTNGTYSSGTINLIYEG